MLIPDREVEQQAAANPVPPAASVPAPTPRRRASLRVAHWLMTLVVWVVLGSVGGVAVATLAPPVAHYRALTVFTGSMTPTLGVGSVVVDEPVRPREVRPGDVVTFPNPNDNKTLLTHRIRSTRFANGRMYAITKGDANNTVERWNVASGDQLGRVVYTLPKVGYVRQWLAGPTARLALLAALALVGLLVLWDVWRPEKSQRAQLVPHEDQPKDD